MTDTPDTSPEAVERMAMWFEADQAAMEAAGIRATRSKLTATLLRQLVKERDEARNAALEEALHRLQNLPFNSNFDAGITLCIDAIRALKEKA